MVWEQLQGLPDDVALKMRRATNHLIELNAQFANFGEREPYSDVGELNLDPPNNVGKYVMRMKIDRPPLVEWGLTIGDCLHNLRSALDCATLALWRRHSGEPGKDQIERIMFPIYTRQKGFRDGRAGKIGKPGAGLHPDAKRVIRSVQPYHRRNDPKTHYLAILHALNNHDKHRLLHPTYAIMEGVPIIERQDHVVITYNSGVRTGGFDDGDPILTLHFSATGTGRPHLSVKMRSTYGIAFDQKGPGRGYPVAELLNDIRLYVRDAVLSPLKPFF